MVDQFSAQAENSGLTLDEKAQITFFITGVGMYGAEVGNGGRKESREKLGRFENDLCDYVSTLLAERDAEIERLKARQITPEMSAVWDEYQAIKTNATSNIEVVRRSYSLRSDLWHAFKSMMGGES